MAGEEEDHKEVFFSTLSSFQRQGAHVDVIVEVENEEFPVSDLISRNFVLFHNLLLCFLFITSLRQRGFTDHFIGRELLWSVTLASYALELL